ncbi:MAG: Sjogren's syndrome/scleroderma autoantigen 1 family protein [Candidatus Bathyarchaeia archaeon]
MTPQEKDKGPSVRKMAELLKSGATMLPENCPDCKVPLFRLKGEVFCPNCGRKVLLVKSDEEVAGATASMALASVEETVMARITALNAQLKTEANPKELESLGNLLSMWLDILGKIKTLKAPAEKAGAAAS